MPRVLRRGHRVRSSGGSFGPPPGGGNAEVLAILNNKFANILCLPCDLYRNFHTVALRNAFRDYDPLRFYTMLCFYTVSYYAPNNLFTRNDVMSYVAEAQHQFEAPDLTTGAKKYDTLELRCARAQWWVENQLPLTADERRFVSEHLPELAKDAMHCPNEKKKYKHA